MSRGQKIRLKLTEYGLTPKWAMLNLRMRGQDVSKSYLSGVFTDKINSSKANTVLAELERLLERYALLWFN